MRLAYDSPVDAAYLTLGGEIGPGEVLGFEILGASVVLSEDVISSLS